MNTTSIITIFFRLVQLVPLVLVLIPIVYSYWQRKNKINGLRKIRVALIILISSIIFSNLYFIFFSAFTVSRASSLGIVVLLVDKIVNLSSYLILYWLFRHASKDTRNSRNKI